MVRKSFLLATGQRMEYELLSPATIDCKKPVPFLVSVAGCGQLHVNGFSQRLMSEDWVVAVAIRPANAPLLFQGSGAQGDGAWHLHQLCSHLLQEHAVSGGRFLLAGVSNGGNSVLRFATLWPELCCGVVAVTGSLQGLAELPAACRRLQGIPVDMYVGTRDECGFYEPMVALEAHFKEVGHKPVASLTVFQDGGHICSPLIDDYLIHGKLGMMFLFAGAIGNGLSLHVPPRASRPSDKILASLTAFSSDLGLECQRVAGGGLQVLKAGGPLLTMILPPLKKGLVAAPALPISRHFKAHDKVEVWSNAKQRFVDGEVVTTSEGEEGGVQVVFEDERGKVSKMIPWAYLQEYLRRQGLGDDSVPCAEGFSVGDRTAIWSASQRKWMQDGQVATISREQGITVTYSDWTLSKLVPLEHVPQYLRRVGAVEDDSSPQPAKLPTGPSRRLVLQSDSKPGSQPSSRSASNSPVHSRHSPAARMQVPSHIAANAGTTMGGVVSPLASAPASAWQPSVDLWKSSMQQATSAPGDATSPATSLSPAARLAAAVQQLQQPGSHTASIPGAALLAAVPRQQQQQQQQQQKAASPTASFPATSLSEAVPRQSRDSSPTRAAGPRASLTTMARSEGVPQQQHVASPIGYVAQPAVVLRQLSQGCSPTHQQQMSPRANLSPSDLPGPALQQQPAVLRTPSLPPAAPLGPLPGQDASPAHTPIRQLSGLSPRASLHATPQLAQRQAASPIRAALHQQSAASRTPSQQRSGPIHASPAAVRQPSASSRAASPLAYQRAASPVRAASRQAGSPPMQQAVSPTAGRTAAVLPAKQQHVGSPSSPATGVMAAQLQQASLPGQLPVHGRVQIWSASSKKWFDDGRVEKVLDEGVHVKYAGRTMQKMVLPRDAPQLLRQL